MARFVNAARGLFKKHPFLTNSAIYGSLYVGAEFSQQFVTKQLLADLPQREPIDYPTIGRYAVMGTMVYAPTLYTWYKWLDRTFPGTARPIIVKKLLVDQFVLTPFLLTAFYAGMSLMEGAADPFLELREKFVPTFLRSCIFWLPAQSLNFLFIAPRFRVIYMGVCGFLWVNILCWIKRQRMQVEDETTMVDTNNNNNNIAICSNISDSNNISLSNKNSLSTNNDIIPTNNNNDISLSNNNNKNDQKLVGNIESRH